VQPVATAPPVGPFIPVEVRDQLKDLESRLDFATTESLLQNASSIRSRFQEIQDLLPEELKESLHRISHIEFRLPDYNRAQRNIDNRAGSRRLQAVAEEALKRSEVEVDKLNAATERQTQAKDRLSRLEQEKADLEAVLEAKKKEVAEAQAQLEAVGVEFNTQVALTERAIEESQAASSGVPAAEVGSDDHDNNTIAEIDAIRTHALNTIRHFLYPR
jgi:multidrug resistance efflux pump